MFYGDDGTTTDYCPSCKTKRLLLLAASQWVGILLNAMCDHCGDEFVYLRSNVAADLAECRRGY